jgi:hypothetical protein
VTLITVWENRAACEAGEAACELRPVLVKQICGKLVDRNDDEELWRRSCLCWRLTAKHRRGGGKNQFTQE